MPQRAKDIRRRTSLDGSSCVFVAVDGAVVGALVIDDPIRPDSPRVIRSLRRTGIDRVIMVTGDHPDVAESVGAALGVDRILSERTPAEKVEAVGAEREHGVTIMVGDGLNDAPALAAADVGVAMGARGATASSEAADMVLVVDRLDRLVDAISIAQRSRRIAVQSGGRRHGAGVRVHVPGRVRVHRAGRRRADAGGDRRRVDPERAPAPWAAAAGRSGRRCIRDVAERFRAEHREFAPEMARIRTVADRLGTMSPDETTAGARGRAVVHRRAPARARGGGGGRRLPRGGRADGWRGPDELDGAGAHRDRSPRPRVSSNCSTICPPRDPTPEDLMDLRRVLYGLYAVLRLHFAQEEEAYAWLASEAGPARPVPDRRPGRGAARAGRQRHPERGPAALPLLAPTPRPSCSAANRRHERQADAEARRPVRGRPPWENGSKMRSRVVGRHAGPVVLHDDQRAVVGALHPHPDASVARRVLDGVAEQVLDDPLDHGRVGRRSPSGAVSSVQAASRDRVGVGDELADERPQVERREHRLDHPAAEALEVEQVGHDAIEPPGVRGDPAGQVARLVRRQLQVVAFQGPARPRIAASGDRRSWETACRNVFFIASASRSVRSPSRSLREVALQAPRSGAAG